MPRRSLLSAALVLLAMPATAAADYGGGAVAPTEAGGAQYGQPRTASSSPSEAGGAQYGQPRTARPKPSSLTATLASAPATLGGEPARLTFRVAGRPERVRVRIDVLRSDGSLLDRLALGVRRTQREYTKSWTPGEKTPAGAYVARLVATDTRRGARAARAVEVRAALAVTAAPAAPPPSTDGVFPVAGPYSYGGADARFGADRGKRLHQGQDLMAPEGTPLVSPKAGVVYFKAYQSGGAGHYLVIRGQDNRDYVFMHLREASPLAKDDRVAAGQQIGTVGNTGSSSAAHLHFEIWPGGWYAKGAQPIDPLPELKAWASG